MSTTMDEARRDAFAERVFGASIAMMEMLSIYLGERLGLYIALRDGGPATPPQLAARAGTHERYTREWLEQQAVAGILDVDDVAAEASARRYRLDPAHAEVLADHESLNYLAPLARLLASTGRALDALVEAYRSGGGVPWSAYGAERARARRRSTVRRSFS